MFNSSYSQFYDLFNRDKPYQKEVEFVYKWAQKPESIIDLGCGTANYWKYYPKETKIIGLDKSASMINKNKPVVRGDVKDLPMFFDSLDCATALFDVLNYIQSHEWWKNIPIKKGGYFVFDIWDKKKVDKQGFKETAKTAGNLVRSIVPISYDGKSANLSVMVFQDDTILACTEIHKMYVHSHKDIERFCGKEFEIVDVKPTKRWQCWYKLRRL